MMKPKITLVVAVAQNGIIGREGDMPWKLSTDLKRFKALTLGKPIVMGRKTFSSIGRALPGRLNIVITRDKSFKNNEISIVHSGEQAIEAAIANNEAEICIIGGGEIYKMFFDAADELHVTHVEAEPDGDTIFPEIDSNIWLNAFEETVEAGENDTAKTRYVIYKRIIGVS